MQYNRVNWTRSSFFDLYSEIYFFDLHFFS
jgi:hypothetical protein